MTLDTLHLVFSAFGTVQKIATFEKQSGFQALVQYPDAMTAEQVRGHLRATQTSSYVAACLPRDYELASRRWCSTQTRRRQSR